MTIVPEYRATGRVERPVDGKINLVGLTREEIAEALVAIGEPARATRMRANQLWHWIYFRGVRDFALMSTISKTLQARLAEHFVVARPEITSAQLSSDGTRKWLVRFPDRQEVECVHIPEEDRGALCVSSQVGCTLTCTFCHTGTQKLVRNLTPAEIVSQMMVARDAIGEWPSPTGERMISNIVMMGMGEPLLNYENVAKALKIVMDGEGIALSKRRITLSTSGVVPMIERCGAELGVNLAISLHAVNDELRDVLVPINRRYPIKELLQACRDYPAANNARRITFEYVMLRDVNDSPADARALVRLLDGLPAKVNLIPFNPWPGAPYDTSTHAATKRFADIVLDAGYSSPVRVPRGRDIMAACGQLKSASEKERVSKRLALAEG
ncbi:23S rRNA (adenine(2503)-C(2))-methyltransferase RlmN [Oceanibacterium hippocampi]|uniref:Dual-specificity RNA methyltransferase RlmN n=1 Tax=Oceanibacterium hippocampi TaxID=745714 RepID=A0A1Y5RBD3_9PROT|nr:23S rRNA (adenine(2503)-C(2))-methyltransferase RlmN [Oceanibacterium hippocampi]SLN12334.1 Dual-specificity RNA methyltransferase RlmN [Oceanibacterium hippocampi]